MSGAHTVARAVTSRQLQALEAAFEKGGAWYGLKGSRAGGAYSRLCGRLAMLGLVERNSPYAITIKGMEVLRYRRAVKYAKHGSMASLLDLEKVDEAIASARGGIMTALIPLLFPLSLALSLATIATTGSAYWEKALDALRGVK